MATQPFKHVDLAEQPPINLDCFVDPSEAIEAAAEINAIAQVLIRLGIYAEQKAEAMRLRKDGQIAMASVIERDLERAYKWLPQWARW